MELFDAIDQMISSDVILAIDEIEASGEVLASAVETSPVEPDRQLPVAQEATTSLPAAPGPITNVVAEVVASSVGAALDMNPTLLVRGESSRAEGGKGVGPNFDGPTLHPDTERGFGMGSRNSSMVGIAQSQLWEGKTQARSAGGAACEASSNKRKRAAESLSGEKPKEEEPKELPLSRSSGRVTRRRNSTLSRKRANSTIEPLEQHAVLRVMRGRGRDVSPIFLPNSELRHRCTDEDVRTFDKSLVIAASEGTVEDFERLIVERGALNACSRFGEGILHMLARRGDSHVDKLRIMLAHGASAFVCDDYGRAPLHDAFWSIEPAMETVTALLLANDGEGGKLMAAVDCRGATPLNYARKQHHEFWRKFFSSRAASIWPRRTKKRSDDDLSER